MIDLMMFYVEAMLNGTIKLKFVKVVQINNVIDVFLLIKCMGLLNVIIVGIQYAHVVVNGLMDQQTVNKLQNGNYLGKQQWG